MREEGPCAQCENPLLKGLHSCGKALPAVDDPSVVAMKEGYMMGFEHGYMQLVTQHFGRFLNDGTLKSIRHYARSIAGRTWQNAAAQEETRT